MIPILAIVVFLAGASLFFVYFGRQKKGVRGGVGQGLLLTTSCILMLAGMGILFGIRTDMMNFE